MTPSAVYKSSKSIERLNQRNDPVCRAWRRSSLRRQLNRERDIRLRTLFRQIHNEIDPVVKNNENENGDAAVIEYKNDRRKPSINIYEYFNDGRTKPVIPSYEKGPD